MSAQQTLPADPRFARSAEARRYAHGHAVVGDPAVAKYDKLRRSTPTRKGLWEVAREDRRRHICTGQTHHPQASMPQFPIRCIRCFRWVRPRRHGSPSRVAGSPSPSHPLRN